VKDGVGSAAEGDACGGVGEGEFGVVGRVDALVDFSKGGEPGGKTSLSMEIAVNDVFIIGVDAAEDAREGLVGEAFKVEFEPEASLAGAVEGETAEVFGGYDETVQMRPPRFWGSLAGRVSGLLWCWGTRCGVFLVGSMKSRP